MYPTCVVGLVLVGVAFAHAWHPTRRRAGIVRSLSMLTFLVSTLGFITGAIRTLLVASDAPIGELARLVVGGLGESLNNIGLGLVLLVIAWTAHTVGAARLGAKSTAADLEAV
ncbi:MAG: hypothetical protein NT062_10625 [Proteobacteria bacterium]|nr:hypothetical protein [Pseudomonadota bacterium]